MLVLSLGPVLGAVGAIAVVLGAGIFALIVTAESQLASEHDPERAIRALTQKVRQPWRYRVLKLTRGLR
jgi:hypothetical protein